MEGEGRMMEKELVWVESPKDYRYVRESYVYLRTRVNPPAKDAYSGKLVGYTTLKPDVARGPGGQFRRRIFRVYPHDICEDGPYGETGMPCEGLAPSDIELQ